MSVCFRDYAKAKAGGDRSVSMAGRDKDITAELTDPLLQVLHRLQLVACTQ